MEAIKADYFVTPAVEFGLEDEAGGKWRWVPAKEEIDRRFIHISFP